MDSIALIRAAGIEVEFPEAQTCCGQPAYSSGFTNEARRVRLQRCVHLASFLRERMGATDAAQQVTG